MPKQATVPEAYPSHRPCPICSEDLPREIFNNRMAPLDGLDMSYRISQCGGCGFNYASDLPKPSTYANYYRRMSKYDLPFEGWISATTKRRIDAALSLCLPRLPSDALIVDIGCGSGFLLAAFKEKGFSKLYGIDPALGASREAKRQFDLSNVISGSLQDAAYKLPLKQCDLLCLTGVAEHLSELTKDFRILLASLPSKAKVLVEVPALERFAKRDCEPFGEFSLEHIQYFSQESLTTLMKRFGYSPVERFILSCTGCSDSLFGLFSRETLIEEPAVPLHVSLNNYIQGSNEIWNRALAKISRHEGALIIFGAGSHTARLLPALENIEMNSHVVGIVDNNPNLQGITLGRHYVHSSEFLIKHPGVPVLVSSFHAQSHIAAQLSRTHPCLCLYDIRQ